MVNSDKEKPVSLAPLKTAEALRGLFKVDPATLDEKKSKKKKAKKKGLSEEGRGQKVGQKESRPKGRREAESQVRLLSVGLGDPNPEPALSRTMRDALVKL